MAVVILVPVRATYLIARGANSVKVLSAVLLIPWAYYGSFVLRFGFVSMTNVSGGPTLNPYIWTAQAFAWLLVEFLHREARQRRTPEIAAAVLMPVAAALLPMLGAVLLPFRSVLLLLRGRMLVRVLAAFLLGAWSLPAIELFSAGELPRTWSFAPANVPWFSWLELAGGWFIVEVIQYQPAPGTK